MYSNYHFLLTKKARKDFRAMFDQSLQPKATSHATSKLIFIVEDDEDIGNLLVRIIQQETIHKVIHHINARNALNAITHLVPQLLLIDYSLPDMNGLELYDWFQSFEHLKYASTILMSARNPPLEEINKRGILYLRKPFAVTELLATIEKLFTGLEYKA
jgi:DNA-binding response OmpR family regulator